MWLKRRSRAALAALAGGWFLPEVVRFTTLRTALIREAINLILFIPRPPALPATPNILTNPHSFALATESIMSLTLGMDYL